MRLLWTCKIFLQAKKSLLKVYALTTKIKKSKRFKGNVIQFKKKIMWIYQDTMISSSLYDKYLHCKWWNSFLDWSEYQQVEQCHGTAFWTDIIHWFCFIFVVAVLNWHNVFSKNFQKWQIKKEKKAKDRLKSSGLETSLFYFSV